MYSLLLVEDDRHLRLGLVELLTAAGYSCHACASVEEAEQLLAGGAVAGNLSALVPDLCILDRHLPGVSGDELCRRLRQHHPLLPVLMLSARGQVADRVSGLRAGADDYLSKPFVIDELLARLAGMTRRLSWMRSPERSVSGFFIGDRYINCQALSLGFADGRQMTLHLREFRLLELLYQRRGEVVSRDELYDRGWGREHLPNSRALDQYMVGLRARLEDTAKNRKLIQTVRGVGYCYQPDLADP